MFSSNLSRKILFVIFVFLLPIEVWANIPTKAVEIRLESEVSVSGDAVVLGDVATIYAKSIRDFNTLSNLTLSKIPADSGELKLPQAYLEDRIREALPEGTEFKLSAPAQVVFRLARQGVSPSEFTAEISRRARAEGKVPEWAELEVEPVGGFDQLKLWKLSDTRIEPAAQINRWKGELTFKVARADKPETLVWVKVNMRWFTQAWVAKHSVGILSVLKPEDFSPSRIEVTALREDPILATEKIETVLQSARAKRSIAASSALSANAIERAPDIRTGQALRVIFISESGVRVTTEGAIIGSGSIGSEVRAKLRTSRKVVTGKLVSGDLMEVSL